MKNSLSSVFLIVTAPFISGDLFGQGLIMFANNNNTLVTSNTVSGSGPAPLSSISGIEIQLFYQPGNNPAPGPLLQGGIMDRGAWEAMQGGPQATIAITPGRFNGGTETTGSDVAPNGNVWLTVAGWSGGYSSLQAALASSNPNEVMAESASWSQATGSGGPASIVGANQFSGMAFIYDSPEPETCWLILCGAVMFGANRWRWCGASSKFKV